MIQPDELPPMDPVKGFVPVDSTFGVVPLPKYGNTSTLNELEGENVIVTTLTGEMFVGLFELQAGNRFSVGNSRHVMREVLETIRKV